MIILPIFFYFKENFVNEGALYLCESNSHITAINLQKLSFSFQVEIELRAFGRHGTALNYSVVVHP